jgi:hypothetical protein
MNVIVYVSFIAWLKPLPALAKYMSDISLAVPFASHPRIFDKYKKSHHPRPTPGRPNQVNSFRFGPPPRSNSHRERIAGMRIRAIICLPPLALLPLQLLFLERLLDTQQKEGRPVDRQGRVLLLLLHLFGATSLF